MSLQWTLVAVYLYFELALVTLLVLPVISAKRWAQFFKSRSVKTFLSYSSKFYYVLLLVLLLFLLDSLREMSKYSSIDHSETHAHLDAEMQTNMKLFRAQRNFYISGFALFLSFLIRRLISIISRQACLQAESEAALQQAKNATSTANELLNKKGGDSKEPAAKTQELEAKVKSLEKELEKTIKDKDAIKSQAESVSKEYDRLLEEHDKLLKKVDTAAGDTKKSD